MEFEEKPICRYGAKCYRKNPSHFRYYSHPKSDDETCTSNAPPAKKMKFNEKEKDNSSKPGKKMKQNTINFAQKLNCVKPNRNCGLKNFVKTKSKKIQKHCRQSKITKKNSLVKVEQKHFDLNEGDNNKKEATQDGLKTESEKVDKILSTNKNLPATEESSNECENVQSTSWVYIKEPSNENLIDFSMENFTNRSVQEKIKALYLMDMPKDFYSFFEFCKFFNENNPLQALNVLEMKLVGPFETLHGDNKKYSLDKEENLCHWRFFYDPPEFQTVLASFDSEFHIGYWRDEPKELPVFLASNESDKSCTFKIEAGNIFGAVWSYSKDFIKLCDPFKKVEVSKFQTVLSDWARKNEYSLEKKNAIITARQKKVVSKTFHKAGIVVPVEAKTEVGYRPLIETEAKIKNICEQIMNANDESSRQILWENLQPLINAANIANDECDFGNSLELGIDLFCMGSPVFHKTVQHLLITAYSLLNRHEFEEIIKAHLKNRRKGKDMNKP